MMRLLASALLVLSISGPASADGPANVQGPAKVVGSANAGATNVVLVHGGTTDGSGWRMSIIFYGRKGWQSLL